MRGLALSRRSPILFSLLILAAHVLWAQRSPLEEMPVQLLITRAQLATVSEAPTHLHFTYAAVPLSFEQNQGPTESRLGFFAHQNAGNGRLPTRTNTALDQATRTVELRSDEKYFVFKAPSKGLTFAPTYGKEHHETLYGVEELEYYAHHIPWAGSLIVRICRQAKVHPHIASVVRMLRPQF